MSTVIQNTGDVHRVLKFLNMPKINEPALIEISGEQVFKSTFLQLLASAEDGNQQSQANLRVILECLCDVTLQCLATIGVSKISMPSLVGIAFGSRASLFRAMVSAALTGRGTEKDIAVNRIYDELGLERSSPQRQDSNQANLRQSQQQNSNGGGQRQAANHGNGNSASNNQHPASSGNSNAAAHKPRYANNQNESQSQSGNSSHRNSNSQINSDPVNRGGQGYQSEQSSMEHGNSNQSQQNVRNIDEYRGRQEPEEGPVEENAFEYMHFYAKSYACCFNKVEKKGKEVINIDFAIGSKKDIDWKNKIVFQCSSGEMVYLYGVLMGYIPGWRSEMHATTTSPVKKTLEIEAQQGGYFLSLMATGEKSGRALKIPSQASASLKAFVYARLKTFFEGCSDPLIHEWVKAQCKDYQYEKKARNASNA